MFSVIYQHFLTFRKVKRLLSQRDTKINVYCIVPGKRSSWNNTIFYLTGVQLLPNKCTTYSDRKSHSIW